MRAPAYSKTRNVFSYVENAYVAKEESVGIAVRKGSGAL